MLIPIILFALGLLLLIKGGDWFVDGASGIARRFRIPEILIGATVVSIGTTLPEVMVSASSAVIGHSEISYGNAIGSIICNTSLVAALTVAIRPTSVDKKTFVLPVIFFFIAAVFYALVSYITGEFNTLTGVLLLVTFVTYMVITVKKALGNKSPETETDEQEENKSSSPLSTVLLLLGTAVVYFVVSFFFDKENFGLFECIALVVSFVLFSVFALVEKRIGEDKTQTLNNVVFLIIGAAVIAVGANLLVSNGTLIAEGLGVPESVIALTFVALGTSLPELVTAITSLVKGHSSLSLGNIIGANLFNLVLVSGLSITLSPFSVPASKLISGMNASLLIDIPVMFAVMLILTVPTLIKGKLSRWQGISLLAIYAGFCVFQFAF